MASPLRGFLDLRKREIPLALLMFGYFFAVITTFWILKPIKKTAFIGYYKANGGFDLFGGDPLNGSQAELLAKVLNMVVAFAAVVVFSALARNLRRQQLTWVFCGFSALSLAGFLLGGQDGELSVWLFYLFGDLFNTLMVATFFAFLNDSFAPEAARRTYGPIVLGGVCGGAFGSLFVASQVKSLSFETWLWIAIGLTALVALLAGLAGREVVKLQASEPAAPRTAPEAPREKRNPAVAGLVLVSKSRYLLAIVVLVGLYEIISTTLDFQFTATIEALVPRAEQGAAYAEVYAVTNVFAMVFQLFVTSAILKRFGVRGALLLMPAVVFGASLGFLAAPTVLFGSLLTASDNGLSYSLNQSAREALYTVTSREEKYQAKAFIDMFVQRFAKALAVGLSLVFTIAFDDFTSLRWLSLIALAGAAAWFFVARYAGKKFEAAEHAADAIRRESP